MNRTDFIIRRRFISQPTSSSSKFFVALFLCLILSVSAYGEDRLVVEDLSGVPSFVVQDTGDVGIGTSNPSHKLHVRGSNDAQILVENYTSTLGERVPFRLMNNGKTRFEIINGSNSWTFDNDGEFFNISKVGTYMNEFRVHQSGSTYTRGTSYALNHVNTSSRKSKRNIQPLNEKLVLAKVMQLPVLTWQYKKGEDGIQHMGPMAEDFHDEFGLGDSEHISTVDTGGVALAAIQGLYQVLKEKDAQIELLKKNNAELAQNNEELDKRLSKLEKLILTRQLATSP